jgi:regulation of enolase protein 1 (concanavalin A-like superfamily)
MTPEITIDGLPAPLAWQLPPVSWQPTGPDAVTVTAGPKTDLFIDPAGSPAQLTAPRALLPVSGDFSFSARVSCDHAATYDAAVLLAWAADDRWAKLCLERSPAGVMTVVSVITRGLSDDANGWPMPGGEVWLRISRHGPAIALHASADGRRWDLVRHLALGDSPGGDGGLSVGISAQSPIGEGATSHFHEIRLAPAGVADIRDGS